jgi:hypothetical protein
VRQYHKYFILPFLIAFSCSKEEVKPADIGLNYIPQLVGAYQVYSVDQTAYSEVAEPEVSHYEIMMEVVDSFPDANSDYTYVIHRSKRETSADDWQYLDTWSSTVNEQKAIVNEENISFVKISFPVKKEKQWNGNEFNINDDDTYEMKSVDEPFTLGDQVFSKTIFIDQEDTEDLLIKDKRFEIYARDIGLIYKEVTHLIYCDDVGCFGQKEIKSGIIFKQSIISHGFN